MLDEKKIEEKAKRYSEVTDCNKAEAMLIEEGFKEGSHWAIQEFLKGLWHPDSEEPKVQYGKCLILRNDGLIVTYEVSCVKNIISHFGGERAGWKSWCYIDDLFPKQKGCEQ